MIKKQPIKRPEHVEVVDVTSLIATLGGPSAVAEGIQKSASTVKTWSSRQSIPVDHWPAIIALAEALEINGIDADFLLALHQQTRQMLAVQSTK